MKICFKTPSKQILEFRKVGFEVSLCHRDGRKCVGKFQGFGLVSGKLLKVNFYMLYRSIEPQCISRLLITGEYDAAKRVLAKRFRKSNVICLLCNYVD